MLVLLIALSAWLFVGFMVLATVLLVGWLVSLRDPKINAVPAPELDQQPTRPTTLRPSRAC